MRCYLSGPMSGLPDWNFPAFHAEAARWRAAGWDVINPAEAFCGATDLPYMVYAEKDYNDLETADAIVMLPGWNGKNARGSVWENVIARRVFGLPVFFADETPDPPFVTPWTWGWEFCASCGRYLPIGTWDGECTACEPQEVADGEG